MERDGTGKAVVSLTVVERSVDTNGISKSKPTNLST